MNTNKFEGEKLICNPVFTTEWIIAWAVQNRKNKKPNRIIKSSGKNLALEIENKKGKLCKLYARGIMKTSNETKHDIKNKSKF